MNFLDILFLSMAIICIISSVLSNIIANSISLILWIITAIALNYTDTTIALFHSITKIKLSQDIFQLFFFPVCVILIVLLSFFLKRIPKQFPSYTAHLVTSPFFGMAKAASLFAVVAIYIERYMISMQDDLLLSEAGKVLKHFTGLF